MRKYIFIALGGMIGAISRFGIKNIFTWNYHENIPINTLIVNITGSFLLALVLTVALEVWNFDADIRIGITTGFLGAYTTFSTLCKETAKMLVSGEQFSAIFYLSISIILGIAAAYFGTVFARETIRKLVKDKQKELKIVEEGEME